MSPTALTDDFSVELETKLLERLMAEWETLNLGFFQQALLPPVLRLSDTSEQLAEWNSEPRTLEVSRALVLDLPWVEVIEALKHEIARQYVDECFDPLEIEHGPVHRKVRERLGLDGHSKRSANGSSTDAAPVEDDRASRALDRIRKLFALAQSPNQHEAEAAATAARRLMLKFNIESEQAAAPSESQRRRFGYRHLGRPSNRILESDRCLANILTRYFFVEGLWIPIYRPLEGKRGRVLEICGLKHNLLMAEHVHAFLSATATRLWSEYKQKAGRGSNRDRHAFLAGVMRGVETKLEDQSQQFQEEGLVWVPAAELGHYFRRRNPMVTDIRRGGARRNDAYSDGRRAGREIVLSKPVESDASGRGTKALRATPERDE